MWFNQLAACVILLAASGLCGWLAPRRAAWPQIIAALLVVAGCSLGMAAALGVLLYGQEMDAVFHGPLVELSLHFHLDALGAFFLVPICLIGAASAVHGIGYWNQARHPRTARRVQLCFGLLIAAMALVVMAADAMAFLMAWEVMALSAFFLIAAEEHKQESREAGWVYFVSTHAGTLGLFAMFTLMRLACGSFEFRVIDQSAAGVGLRTAIFLLALVSFGFKAGVMPLHFWLPGAHASAPSHVSAVLSGVMLKVGIYGMVRVFSLLPVPPMGWGVVVLLAGTTSAILGVAYALGQHDLKRLLAYHSIENIGIILMGLGLALLGRATGKSQWVVLGMAGCLLHVWNHALFKPLLFLAAGSAIHATGTRQIDRLGGLAKVMPKTALLFLIGAVAISGLPPLNGFISELFIYLGLFKSLDGAAAAALAAPALALVGALALACFVKAFGAVFLGEARQKTRRHLHEGPATMLVPMAILALCCVGIGIYPAMIVRPLAAAIGQWANAGDVSVVAGAPQGIEASLLALAPLRAITWISVLLIVLVVAVALVARMGGRRFAARRAGTWDCGYIRPTARMQYTAASFAGMLVELFASVLRPTEHRPKIDTPFAPPTEFESHVDDVVLTRWLLPLWSGIRSYLGRLRVLQHGSVQAYVLYILLALLLAMLLPLKEMLWW